jgi:arylsulfatase A-like enzyme
MDTNHKMQVGKWHLGYYQRRFQPLARGFDSFFGFLNGAEYYFSHVGRVRRCACIRSFASFTWWS